MSVPKSKVLTNKNTPEGNAVAAAIPIHKSLTKDDVRDITPVVTHGEWVAILPIDEEKQGNILVVETQTLSDMYPIGIVVGVGDTVPLSNLQTGDCVAYLPKSRALELKHEAYERSLFIVNYKNIFCTMK